MGEYIDCIRRFKAIQITKENIKSFSKSYYVEEITGEFKVTNWLIFDKYGVYEDVWTDKAFKKYFISL